MISDTTREALSVAGKKGGAPRHRSSSRKPFSWMTHEALSAAGKKGGAISAQTMSVRWRGGVDRGRYHYAAKLRYAHGLEVRDVAALWERQGGMCPICLTVLDPMTFVIDHDHVTRIVRGLLHDKCNWTYLRICEKYGDRALVYAAITPVDLYLVANGGH